MYGTGAPRGGCAHDQRKSIAQPVTRAFASIAARRLWHAAAGIVVATLLTACSGTLPFLPGNHDQQAYAVAPAKPKQMRATTARDILAEWSTFGVERKPSRRDRMASITRAYDLVPDYSLTIDEIMANAVCYACEQKPYHQMVVNASNQHGVPASLIHAVIQKESGYNPSARSKRKARGLMQITPETARFVGIRDSRKLYDPQTNINAGTAYLKYLMANHDTVDEVLAAYNSGPGNVRKYNGVPPFRETKRYVRDVKKYYASTSTRQQQ